MTSDELLRALIEHELRVFYDAHNSKVPDAIYLGRYEYMSLRMSLQNVFYSTHQDECYKGIPVVRVLLENYLRVI